MVAHDKGGATGKSGPRKGDAVALKVDGCGRHGHELPLVVKDRVREVEHRLLDNDTDYIFPDRESGVSSSRP
jgi:hypothetical protein